ncbi:MAG: HutD family protein [Achromobacter sp.]|uniref:HutD/Ves family protein n=1 Tax=Achromobacter sp. TaxID=134375 RepID=UPI0012BF3264|nr:HutD family protein [Achromobacter sp.]MPS79395.1 HutD family protein [Achromobacter sp.]
MRAQASWLALPPEPWKNGGGVTRTVSVDAVQQPPRWRVSVADIDHAGPYSRYPGYDRVSVVLTGGGVALRAGDASVCLMPGVATAFTGDAAFDCRLTDGPVRVLNLFVLRGAARASVTCISAPRDPKPALDGSQHTRQLAPQLATQPILLAGNLTSDGTTTQTLRIAIAIQAGRLNVAPGADDILLAAGDYAIGLCADDAAPIRYIATTPPRPGALAAVLLDVVVTAPAFP